MRRLMMCRGPPHGFAALPALARGWLGVSLTGNRISPFGSSFAGEAQGAINWQGEVTDQFSQLWRSKFVVSDLLLFTVWAGQPKHRLGGL